MANKNLIINSNWELDQKLVTLLMCTAQELAHDMTMNIKRFNLSLIQLQILHVLSEAEGEVLTVNQIKKLMIDDSPNVSRSLNKLMENKYIVKKRNKKDQRIVQIKLTPLGRKIHIDADNEVIKTTVNLADKEKEQLYQLLTKS